MRKITRMIKIEQVGSGKNQVTGKIIDAVTTMSGIDGVTAARAVREEIEAPVGIDQAGVTVGIGEAEVTAVKGEAVAPATIAEKGIRRRTDDMAEAETAAAVMNEVVQVTVDANAAPVPVIVMTDAEDLTATDQTDVIAVIEATETMAIISMAVATNGMSASNGKMTVVEISSERIMYGHSTICRSKKSPN